MHQGSALLFAVAMDRLMDEVCHVSPWTTVFADDIVAYAAKAGSRWVKAWRDGGLLWREGG